MRRALLLGLFIPILAVAGRADDKHANHYEPVRAAGSDVRLGVIQGFSRQSDAKIKLSIENTTRDWILYRSGDTELVFGDTHVRPKKKSKLFPPKSTGSRTLTLVGEGLHTDTATINPAGFYRVPFSGATVLVNDLRLPLEKKEVEGGGFRCRIAGKVKQETDKTAAKLKCQYVGDDIGLIDPSKLQVRLEDGQLFANNASSLALKPKLLEPGDTATVTAVFQIPTKAVDMQFATLFIQFNDTFTEAKPVPINLAPIPLTLDVGLTAEKND